MTVSVVIPCHNAAPYLAQTIGSVLDQSHPSDRIVIVDDGSTDESLSIANRFAAQCPGLIYVLSRQWGSAPRTRNLGAAVAGGDAIMFLDADDLIAPDTLAALVETLQANPGAVAVCPWHRLEQVDGRWIRRPPTCRPRRDGEDALSAWLTGWYHPPCSVLWSRAAYERTGGWDERAIVNNDGDTIMRALADGVPLVRTERGAGYYRRLPEGESSLSGTRFTRDGLLSRIRTVRKIACWLDERQRLDEHRAALAASLYRIAADAGDHPDIRATAHAAARDYRLPLWTRVKNRLVPRRIGSRTAIRPPDEGEVIDVGAETASRILASPPMQQEPGRSGGGVPIAEPPAVSVIIPAYNRAHVIRRAIDSVLAQTFGDLELLVVDDGSTDNTADIVQGYTDARVRYLRQPRNAGVSAARNRGLRAARGELIAMLDSDDQWMPRKLEIQVPALRAAPADVGVLYTGVVDDDGRGNTAVFTPSYRGDVHPKLLTDNVLHGAPSSALLRLSVVATVGFFDEQIPAIEDYDYWLRVARFFRFEFVPDVLVRYDDPHVLDRKSLNVQENLDARAWFYRKHAAALRRADVAHLFLFRSIRRALRAPRPDLARVRRLALRAVIDRPSRATLGMLRRVLLTRGGQEIAHPPRPVAQGWSKA